MTSATLQPCRLFQLLERFTRRDATMLTAVADEDHPSADSFGHVEDAEHIPRAELTGFIDEDDAIPGRFLHLLVLQEPGHRVGLGEASFLAQHFPAGLHRLSQGDHRLDRLRPKPRRFPVRASFCPFRRLRG